MPHRSLPAIELGRRTAQSDGSAAEVYLRALIPPRVLPVPSKDRSCAHSGSPFRAAGCPQWVERTRSPSRPAMTALCGRALRRRHRRITRPGFDLSAARRCPPGARSEAGHRRWGERDQLDRAAANRRRRGLWAGLCDSGGDGRRGRRLGADRVVACRVRGRLRPRCRTGLATPSRGPTTGRTSWTGGVP